MRKQALIMLGIGFLLLVPFVWSLMVWVAEDDRILLPHYDQWLPRPVSDLISYLAFPAFLLGGVFTLAGGIALFASLLGYEEKPPSASLKVNWWD